jgi:hypothetical protein
MEKGTARQVIPWLTVANVESAVTAGSTMARIARFVAWFRWLKQSLLVAGLLSCCAQRALTPFESVIDTHSHRADSPNIERREP